MARLAFVPLAVIFVGVLVGGFMISHGLWQLLRSSELREYRFLGWAAVLVTLIFIVVGRNYYVAGLYALLFAVSAVHIERHGSARWWRWVPTWPAYLVSAALAVVLMLPVMPVSTVTTVNLVASGSLGWPQVTETVVRAYRGLSPAMRAHAVVVTDAYWQASALEVYGRDRLPPVYSPMRGYWHFGMPPEGAGPVLYVGREAGHGGGLADYTSVNTDYLRRFFTEVRPLAVTRLNAKQDNINQGVAVWLCQGKRAPWPQLWQQMHRL